MKRNSLVLLAIIVASMVLGGCTKDKVSFHARFQKYTPQTGTKVYIDNLTPRWNDGDVIKVNAETAIVSSTGQISEVNDDENGYGLFYPAEWASGALSRSGGVITIPAVQTYVEDGSGNQKVLSPMAAQAYESTEITMYNVCGLLRIQVTNNTGSTMKVTKIELIAEESEGVYLSGTYNLSLSSSSASITYNSGGGKKLTLDCSTASPSVSSGEYKYFYLCVPPFNNSSNRFRVKVYTNVGGYEYLFNKKQNDSGASSILASQIGPVPVSVTSSHKTGAMCGVFSVASNKRVKFSSGNLRYNTSLSQWTFAEHQYDYVGSSQPSNNLIDLFGFGTGNNPTQYSTNDSEYPGSDIGGTIYDWSGNTISDCTIQSWYLLTQAEWNYLINLRTTATRFACARVSSVKGLIVFPDDYQHPATVSGLQNINNPNTGTWVNTFNISDWDKMASAGAVFLPFAGKRIGENVSDVESYGRYWTSSVSSASGNNKSNAIVIQGTANPSIIAQERHKGFSVRLTTIVQ